MKKNKKKLSKKKLFGALALAMLVIGGGALAMPVMDATNYDNSVSVLKDIQQNPGGFLKTNNLLLEKDLDYFKELNKEFVSILNEEDRNAINEGAVTEALKNKDYEAWQAALKSLDGYPGEKEIMTKEDFEILAALHK